jgi:hypothetical protein
MCVLLDIYIYIYLFIRIDSDLLTRSKKGTGHYCVPYVVKNIEYCPSQVLFSMFDIFITNVNS